MKWSYRHRQWKVL